MSSSAPASTVAKESTNGTAHSNAHKGQPSFTELVYAHFSWWGALRTGGTGATEAVYRDSLRRFELRHGRIVKSYWCSDLESAIALTELKRKFPLRSTLSCEQSCGSNVLITSSLSTWSTPDSAKPEAATMLRQ